MQQRVDVSYAGPVPAGRTGQHLGQAAGVVPPTVEPMVPEDLVICPLQPGDRAETEGEGGWVRRCLHKRNIFRLFKSDLSINLTSSHSYSVV